MNLSHEHWTSKVKSFFDAVADASCEWTLIHVRTLTANMKEMFRFGNRLVLKSPKVQTYHKVLSGTPVRDILLQR